MTQQPEQPELTDKQRLFIEEYLVDLNGAAAARRAGYSPDTAKEMAYENLTKPHIRGEIDRRLNARILRANEVLALLSDQANASLEDFLTESGEIDLKAARKAKKLHLLKKVKTTTRYIRSDEVTQTTEIELHDVQNAQIQLGKYHKLFSDRLVLDWRSELKAAGIDVDPEKLEDELAKYLADAESRSTGEADS